MVKDNLYGYVNTNGEMIIEPTIPYQEGVLNWALFSDRGYARQMTEGKMGLIDTTGKKVVPALFEDIGVISKELIAIKRHGKWGYCDFNSKLKIPYNFTIAGEFIDDVAIVKFEDKYGIINTKGTYIIPAEYNLIERFLPNLFIAEKDGKKGLISIENTQILPFLYDKIELTNDKKLIKLITKNEVQYMLKPTLIKE